MPARYSTTGKTTTPITPAQLSSRRTLSLSPISDIPLALQTTTNQQDTSSPHANCNSPYKVHSNSPYTSTTLWDAT